MSYMNNRHFRIEDELIDGKYFSKVILSDNIDISLGPKLRKQFNESASIEFNKMRSGKRILLGFWIVFIPLLILIEHISDSTIEVSIAAIVVGIPTNIRAIKLIYNADKNFKALLNSINVR